MDNGHSQFEMRVLHALLICKLECLCDGAAGLGHYLIVLSHVLTLKHHRVKYGLPTVVYKSGNDFDNCFGMEKILRECDSHVGFDVAGNHFKNLRVAAYGYFFGAFSHFLGTAAGLNEQSCRNDHEYVKNLFHFNYFKKIVILYLLV